MWAVCASGWMFLLSLAVVLLSSGSPVQCLTPDNDIFCCGDETHKIVETKIPQKFIQKCFLQEKRLKCDHRAFLVITKKKRHCISTTAAWINSRLKTGPLTCPPDILG